MRSNIISLLLCLMLAVLLVQAAPVEPATKVTRNERLTNAQRIKRGMAPAVPKRLYDAKAIKRAPLPSRRATNT
ncbi:hypothetical protein IAU60_003819 [Kwoniella sp. DSM 27419]